MTSIEQALVPIPEQDGLIRRMHKDVAAEVTKNSSIYNSGGGQEFRSSYEPRRISDIFVSQFFLLGYAEGKINREIGSSYQFLELRGLIEVPDPIKLAVHARLRTDEKYSEWLKKFAQEWYQNKLNLTNLKQLRYDDDQKKGSGFLFEQYVFGVNPDFSKSLGLDIMSSIDKVSDKVTNLLKEMDGSIGDILGTGFPRDLDQDTYRPQVGIDDSRDLVPTVSRFHSLVPRLPWSGRKK